MACSEEVNLRRMLKRLCTGDVGLLESSQLETGGNHMTMQQVFQDFIDFCTTPATDPGQGRILAFHLNPLNAPDDVYPYNGPAWIRKRQGLQPYVVEGYGIRNTVFGHPTPNDFEDVVHFSVQIGRPNPIESLLEFGGMNELGGFGRAERSESVDATAEQILNDVILSFETSAGLRTATLRKTNLLHSEGL
jgi:hypothetical protein